MGRLSVCNDIRRMVACLMTVVLALAGCSNEPNPQFEQVMEARAAGNANDRYAALGNAPRLLRYLQAPQDQRSASAHAMLQTLLGFYPRLLQSLDNEAAVAGIGSWADQCKALYGEAVVFATDATVPPPSALARATSLYQRLGQCHAQASVQAPSEDAQARTVLLRRFASTGMVLVGVATVVKGHEKVGMDMWHAGDGYVRKDKPGFELNANAFRPQ